MRQSGSGQHGVLTLPLPSALSGWAGFLLALGLTGCSSGPVLIQGDTGGANLAKVGVAYARATDRLGRPPAKLEELKPFLKTEDGPADTLLRSTQDGQPYEILWGVDIFRADPRVTAPTVIAYERKGANGKRYVLAVGVAILSLSDAEFAKAHFPNGHKPPSGDGH